MTISFGDKGEGSRLDDMQSELTTVKRFPGTGRKRVVWAADTVFDKWWGLESLWNVLSRM